MTTKLPLSGVVDHSKEVSLIPTFIWKLLQPVSEDSSLYFINYIIIQLFKLPW